MNNKIRIAIIFGGKSVEHEVSLRSAKNIISALDKDRYEIECIQINKKGHWYALGNISDLSIDTPSYTNLALVNSGNKKLVKKNNFKRLIYYDVVFPILHGPFGEDGTVQGLLKLMDVPYVGADVLGSAIGMAKDVTKRLLREAHILTTDFLVYTSSEIDYSFVKQKFGLPFFVKPANLGSSVGVSKVHNETEFNKAIKEAFSFDTKILIEKNVKGREIECSVLGNENPIASIPGEVIVKNDFYSYEAKYIDPDAAVIDIPAKLPKSIIKKIQNIAVKTFKTLCCSGMARVDFFLDEKNKIYVNEINTIPGFTNISMYPKLWEKSGITYTQLLDRLISLAIERHSKEQKLKTSCV